DEGSIFIRAQNINQDFLDLSDVAYVKLPKNSEGTRTSVKKNDILITITGANVTKTAHVDIDINNVFVSQHGCLVRVENSLLSNYVYQLVLSYKSYNVN